MGKGIAHLDLIVISPRFAGAGLWLATGGPHAQRGSRKIVLEPDAAYA
jgi:hypothetical protein